MKMHTFLWYSYIMLFNSSVLLPLLLQSNRRSNHFDETVAPCTKLELYQNVLLNSLSNCTSNNCNNCNSSQQNLNILSTIILLVAPLSLWFSVQTLKDHQHEKVL